MREFNHISCWWICCGWRLCSYLSERLTSRDWAQRCRHLGNYLAACPPMALAPFLPLKIIWIHVFSTLAKCKVATHHFTKQTKMTRVLLYFALSRKFVMRHNTFLSERFLYENVALLVVAVVGVGVFLPRRPLARTFLWQRKETRCRSLQESFHILWNIWATYTLVHPRTCRWSLRRFMNVMTTCVFYLFFAWKSLEISMHAEYRRCFQESVYKYPKTFHCISRMEI